MKLTDDTVSLTTHQAAKLLGVTIRTVQNWVNSGRLSATLTPGGHRRIPLAEIKAFLSSRPRAEVSEERLVTQPSQDVLKVLVVEDDPTLLTLYKLKFARFSVPNELRTASDGLQGLLTLGLYRPDILILDLMMPAMNGFELLNTLKKMPDFDNMTVIVVSSMSAADIISNGGLPPGVGIVPKPVPFEVIETMFAQKATQIAQEALAEA